ncbi:MULTISPECIES: TolC family protein [Persicobacter]|uniref:Transporter n=1 Tax=Persicobacter diffluens TaxID=981 RepID=A0AAN4VYF4_9BACT|nr:TolC family protein [Persicobacter sp. CCB-QB2]GJM61110.1 transporter [Persicobacter diffluens]
MRLPLMLLLLLFGPLVRAEENLSGQPVTLEQCIQIALKNNQNVQKAALEVHASDYKVKETLSIGLPQVNGQIDANYNFAIRTSFVPAAFFLPPDEDGNPAEGNVPVQFGVPYDAAAGITVSQLIFDGSFFVGLEAARTYVELSEKDLYRQEIDVVESVKKAYYLVLINKERLNLVEQNLGRLDTLLTETQAMYEEGFAEKIDVDRIKVSYNNVRASLKSSQRLIELSVRLLTFNMGLDVNQPVVVTDTIHNINFDATILDADLAFDPRDRVEMQILDVREELGRYELKNVNAQYLPNLYAIGNMGYNAGVDGISDLGDFSESWFGYGIVGLQMKIPIFDGLMKRHKAQQVKIKLQQIEIDRNMTMQAIDNEIFQSKANLLTAIDQLNIEQENVDLAEDVYETTRLKFQEGVGTNLELVDANNSYVTAQVNYFNALYDALLNKVNLEKSVGRLYNR